DDPQSVVDHRTGTNIGTTTSLSGTVGNDNGRNTTRTGVSATSDSGEASTMYVGSRTRASSASATSAVTNGTTSAHGGRNARWTTAHENNVASPETGSQVSAPPSAGQTGSGYQTISRHDAQRGITNSLRAAAA